VNRINRVLIGILLLPVVFGGLVLWSMGDRTESADRVPAAVVNLDKPVTMGSGKDEQIVAAGRLLAAGMTSPSDKASSSLGWELTDSVDAQSGLKNGDYYAVVTIPRDFSKTLSRMSGDDPAKAGITLQTNDASSAVIGEASKQVTEIATARLGQTITANYLKGAEEQTGKLKSRLGEAAGGAGKLSDGTTQVEDGARQLDSGASALASGLSTLSGGADQLATGSRKLSTGTKKLHDGTGRLADGLGLLSRRTDPLPSQTRRLADGAGQLSDGVGPYTKIVKGWSQACATNPAVSATNPQLCAGTIRAAGVGGRNADKLAAGARQLATGTDELADATPKLTKGIDQSAAGAQKLDRGAGQLATGSTRLADGTARLSTGAQKASTGADKLADGSQQLADGSGQLASGSDKLASGLRTGAEQIPKPSEKRPAVVSDPVEASSDNVSPSSDGVTTLLPAVLAIALWLGAFVTYLVRPALPPERLRMATTGRRVALSGWLPAVGIGLVQAALLFLGARLFGAEIQSPVGLAVLMGVAVASFTAVNQAFVAVSGQRRGWLLSIGFAALQLVSLGGLVPIDTAPGPFQTLNQVLPVARAADGFAHLILGGEVGSLAGDVLVLLLWGVAALAVTALAARRAQKLEPSDLQEPAARETLVGVR